MIATEVRIEHLLQTAEQEGINMPTSASLLHPPDPFGKVAAVQPEFPIEGLVLMAGNTTVDLGDKEDNVVNKDYLQYDLGEFPQRPSSHYGSWSKEIHVFSQARMAADTSDSPKVLALQHGFYQAWLKALGLKKDMSLISDDMSQLIELDNGSILPAYT